MNTAPGESPQRVLRVRIAVNGVVQGVGFRPFVYRLATELGLAGWVCNGPDGVILEIEGEAHAVQEFHRRLRTNAPRSLRVERIATEPVSPRGDTAFTIRSSASGGDTCTTLPPPDLATCTNCLAELFDPDDRRYRYPFIACVDCGPRFTVTTALPYDREHTTMRLFRLCTECSREYHDPANRRFHAQAVACPRCGPQVELWDASGRVLATGNDALLQSMAAISAGAIVAVKGLGGFHLLVDATNEAAVLRLRERKQRPAKPLAVMVPDLDWAQRCCLLTEMEAALLCSAQAPIVLARKAHRFPVVRGAEGAVRLADSIAPGNPYLGIMLPYTPLHHLLAAALRRPFVATSGNRSEEPICTDESDALERLGNVADLFLVHNRPIAQHADDSIVRVVNGRPLFLRVARGYAPLKITAPFIKQPMLAVGAHGKNTIALGWNGQAVLSQHVGDLDTAAAQATFASVYRHLQQIHRVEPSVLVADAHPDYASTRHAQNSGLRVHPVQHHVAHIFACMADNGLEDHVLGVAWDGTGYGLDGTVWGGEFFSVRERQVARVAHLRPFVLLGGEAAIREPRRIAIALLYELFGPSWPEHDDLAPVKSCTPEEIRVFSTMLKKMALCLRTTAVGRLFDGVAALLGLRLVAQFEAQAAMQLEFASEGAPPTESMYPFTIEEPGNDGPLVVDWREMLHGIVADLRAGLPVPMIGTKFHETLAGIVVKVARRFAHPTVVLSGGCFQNKLLLERVVAHLQREGLGTAWPRQIPPNDGSIALGQLVVASREIEGVAEGVRHVSCGSR